MHCSNCGFELAGTARFCSSCGTSLTAIAAPQASSAGRDWNLHVSIVGWLVIAHAALTGIIGLIVMFGGLFVKKLLVENPVLLQDIQNTNPGDVPPPEVVMNLLVPVTFLIGVIFLFIALPSVAAGVGLLRYRSWGRGLTLVLSTLRLLEFPFGTATAVYSFWVLLSEGGKHYYAERAARPETI